MALVAACIRESICTASRIHQHIRKNSVSLKEVLTHRCAQRQRSSSKQSTTRLRDYAKSADAADIGICQHRRKCLYSRRFLHSHFAARCTKATRVSRRDRRKTARRGLRVGAFGNEKIFVGKPLRSHPRWPKPDFGTESRNRRFGRGGRRDGVGAVSATRDARRDVRQDMFERRCNDRLSRAFRCRAWTSGGR